jgi:hypothetical protein
MLETNKLYVLNQIKNCDASGKPWPHLIIENFLPEDLYIGVKQETEVYTKNQILQNTNIRAFHIYVNESVKVSPTTPNLKEYYNILQDSDITSAIKEKLSIKFNPKDFYSELNLFTKGYIYDEIHPDHSSKLITMLHYLAEEGDDEALGTFLYPPNKDATKMDVFEDCVKIAPYVSNTACLFAPKDTKEFKTLHCMANVSEKTFLRKSFQSFWIKEESDWTKDPQTGRIRL